MQTISDYMNEVRREVAMRFPKAHMAFFVGDEVYTPEGKAQIAQFGYIGDFCQCERYGRETVFHSDDAKCFCADIFLDWIANQPNKGITLEEAGYLKDAAIDYAAAIGRNTKGVERYKPYTKRIEHNEETKKSSGYEIGQEFELNRLEEVISMVEEELCRLTRMRNPQNLLPMMKAEAKRLRKSGKEQEAKAKEKEIEQIVTDAKAELERRERKERIRKVALERLVNARAAMAEKRAEEKRKAEQAERDRQRAKQFNPHRAAKAKMKAIKERQEERKASKRKGKEADQYAR